MNFQIFVPGGAGSGDTNGNRAHQTSQGGEAGRQQGISTGQKKVVPKVGKDTSSVKYSNTA